MYAWTGLVLLLACLASAAPTAKYYGIGIEFNVSPSGETPVLEPSPIEINKLTSVHNVRAFKITLDKGTNINVPLDKIECRAYKDAAGVVPGSAVFTYKKPALLSTNLVQVASVLCYIVS